tara:strand:+ start:48778 stop:49083 length:306 start_codon:yes stop_codon:yes gene_type:complete
MDEENKDLKSSGFCSTTEDPPQWQAVEYTPDMIQFTLGNMDGAEVKTFTDELERIKQKHSNSGNPCKFDVVEKKSDSAYMKEVILEANPNMISAYIIEQQT